jgi:hypothetical protein
VATLLYNNSSTLQEFSCHLTFGLMRQKDSRQDMRPSDGSFTRWSLIDKPLSLILPFCTIFELEIGSSSLIHSLYLPVVSSVALSGTAMVRPLPNICVMAPICSDLTLDLSYQFSDPEPEKKESSKKSDATTTKTRPSATENKLKEEASLLSPCPLPLSSILDDSFIDNIIHAISSPRPSLPIPTLTSSSVLKSTIRNGQPSFDTIVIRTGKGYVKLSQLQRFTAAVINNISFRHSASLSRVLGFIS